MKKFVLLSILFLLSIISYAQMRFQATNINIAILNQKTDSLEWGEWEDTNTIILFTKNKINIFSTLEQEFIPISQVIQYSDDEMQTIIFDALDINSSRVTLEFVHWKTGEDQLYITWSNIAICYQMKRL